jgi:hypothetical protein
MGADGHAILVSKTDLRDFVTQIFLLLGYGTF